MIKFSNLDCTEPYILFKRYYDNAIEKNQKNIEAVAISTFDKNRSSIESRFVNLKFIENNNWFFYTNYNSPKSKAIESYDEVAALFYWNSINIQIRIKAKIIKSDHNQNQEYFKNRSKEKNALAISSNQSQKIESYDSIKENYENSLKNDDLKTCPKYWGGFSFKPYYFEFWEGHENRLNYRIEYIMARNNDWKSNILQP